jgi:restriction endonuclease S subunit
MVTSATIAHLTGEKLKSLSVQVPPLDLQTRFAVFVRQADKSMIYNATGNGKDKYTIPSTDAKML